MTKFLVIGDGQAASSLASYADTMSVNSQMYSVKRLIDFDPDVIITFTTEVILSDFVLEHYTCFNIHPAPLPEYAGLYCHEWAIWNGEKEYGATVHRTTNRIDSGDIAYQERFEIRTDNPKLLYAQAALVGLKLGKKLVDDIRRGRTIPCLPQDLSKRRLYTRKDFENAKNKGCC